MKKLLFIVSIFSALAFARIEFPKESLEFLVEGNSEVSISGTTNINDFKCCYNIAKLEDPISVSFESRNENMLFNSTVLELDNKCFDCGNRAINKDFNKLLKTELYPKIKLQLIQIESSSKQLNTYTARVKIFIADNSKTYNVPVEVSNTQSFNVLGNLNLNLEDFHLEPPKKLLGLIVIHDEITVHFNLHLKKV